MVGRYPVIAFLLVSLLWGSCLCSALDRSASPALTQAVKDKVSEPVKRPPSAEAADRPIPQVKASEGIREQRLPARPLLKRPKTWAVLFAVLGLALALGYSATALNTAHEPDTVDEDSSDEEDEDITWKSGRTATFYDVIDGPSSSKESQPLLKNEKAKSPEEKRKRGGKKSAWQRFCDRVGRLLYSFYFLGSSGPSDDSPPSSPFRPPTYVAPVLEDSPTASGASWHGPPSQEGSK